MKTAVKIIVYFVIFINFTIGPVRITAMTISRKICVANNTSRCINTMVCTCQFLVEWEGFSLAHCFCNTWHHWFFYIERFNITLLWHHAQV